MSIVNGRLPATLLTTVYGTQKLRKGDTATSFKRMSFRSKAKGYGAIGINKQSGVNGGYRDRANQALAKKVFGAGAATPGTSNHGLGIAADLLAPYNSTGPKHSWLRDRGHFYGWVCEGLGFAIKEAWHWKFVGFPMRPVLRSGSKGDSVYAWQCVLMEDLKLTSAGIGGYDGVFGPATTKHTKAWQKKNKLTADGIVGPKSWKAAGLA